MTKTYLLLLMMMAAGVATACQNQAQILSQEQGKAIDVAVQRGRFEMACPQATGTILSSNMLQPVMWGGMERAEYTIGVEGCGKRATYISVCQVGSLSCFAVSGSRNTTIER